MDLQMLRWIFDSYLGVTWEIEASFMEQLACCDCDVEGLSLNFSSPFVEKAGLLGTGIASVSFLSMEETSSIDGLSTGFSCTQRRATCKHCRSLQEEVESSRDGSTNSNPLPSFHRS